CRREEMPARVPPPHLLLAHEPKVRLVDQGRGLERLLRSLLSQPLGGEPAQFVVDQRQELLGGGRVALLDGRQDLGDVGHAADNTPAGGKPRPETANPAIPPPGAYESVPGREVIRHRPHYSVLRNSMSSKRSVSESLTPYSCPELALPTRDTSKVKRGL